MSVKNDQKKRFEEAGAAEIDATFERVFKAVVLLKRRAPKAHTPALEKS